MLAYCLNNPTRYVDINGAAAVDIFTEDGEIFDASDLVDRGGSGSSWQVFISTIDALASGFNMAMGSRKSYPNPEIHHVVPHANKTHTPTYEGIVVKYDFSLTSSQNTIPLKNHRGRHTEGYHTFIKESLVALDIYAQGDKAAFAKGFEYLVTYVKNNDWLPYARQ